MTRRQNAAFGIFGGAQVVMLAVNLLAPNAAVIAGTAALLIAAMTVAAVWARGGVA